MRIFSRRPGRASLLVAPVLGLLVAGCGGGSGGGDGVERAAAEPPAAPAAGTGSTAPTCTPAPLEERAGRVLVVGLPAVTASSDPVVTDVLESGVGGVLLTAPNVKSSEQVLQLVSDIKARAQRPLVIATGEESGRVSTFRDLFGRSPSARALAAERSPDGVRGFARDWASKMAALGVTLDLAPVADLDDGPSGGIIGDRSFSADPDRAGAYAVAYLEGLAAGGVLGTAKHFPGHGRVRDDSHIQLTTVDVSLEELRAVDLKPFAALIDAGVSAVMLEHVAYTALDPQLPATLAPRAYELLREMGFQGVAMTDSVGMGAVHLRWPYQESTVMAVAAGADAVLATDGTQARSMRDALVAAVREGRLPEGRLDEAAARMTALAGGDPRPLACREVALPRPRPGA